MRHRQRVSRITAAVLQAMTDAQLKAIAGSAPPDLSSLTDTELDAVIFDHASAELLTRIETLGTS